MELIDAVKARHAVRKYTDKAIEPAKISLLKNEIEKLNALSGLHIQLVLDEPKAGMEAALLAPTAMNQQKFKFTLLEGNRVKAESTFSLTGKSYLNYDLGIVKCHFEIGAGREQFTWI